MRIADELELAAELDGCCHRSSRIVEDELTELVDLLDRWGDRRTPKECRLDRPLDQLLIGRLH